MWDASDAPRHSCSDFGGEAFFFETVFTQLFMFGRHSVGAWAYLDGMTYAYWEQGMIITLHDFSILTMENTSTNMSLCV